MKTMKSLFIALLILSTFSSCGDWLNVIPQNQQVSETYWYSQEDVDAVVCAGYYYLRDMVTGSLIPYGELRGGSIYNITGSKLQSFQVKPTDESICDWGDFYQIINIANSVLSNAGKAQESDETYEDEELNAHYCEAYFLRALCYFYLVRNWRDVPLITVPFENDTYSYQIAKSTEKEILLQIKSDIKTALNTGAAKEFYETTWETKGRATKWALYALMADVCLWSSDSTDYETAIQYCDELINAPSGHAPALLTAATHSSWFSIFNPGNSNESIFEIQWNYEEDQTNTLPILFDNTSSSRLYQLSSKLVGEFNTEYAYTKNSSQELEAVRTMYGGYFTQYPEAYSTATSGWVWKYCGSLTLSDKRTSTYYDPNFIIYRMAEVYLMKAEALVLRNETGDRQEAVNLINAIRVRSNLKEMEYTDDLSEEELLEQILYERRIELVGEGKCWYDELRMGRRDNNKYKEVFLVGKVTDYDQQASESWLMSVLSDDDALFLPISQTEIKANKKLVQNPYYK
jgi:starch-binding outer membrane protein, SusD/RagB family